MRRFDMDGDAKINMAEFALGMKSNLTTFAKKGGKRPKTSAIGFPSSSKLVTSSHSASKTNFVVRQSVAAAGGVTPRTGSGFDTGRRSLSRSKPQRPKTGKQRRKPSLTGY